MCSDVRMIWLGHSSSHGSRGLIWLLWLAGQVPPSSLIAAHVSLPKLFPIKTGGPVCCQGYPRNCAFSRLIHIRMCVRHDFFYDQIRLLDVDGSHSYAFVC